MSKTMQDYLDEYWLEFLEHEELTTNEYQEILGNFWYWFQEHKLPKILGYKIKKVEVRVSSPSSSGRHGNYITKGA